jgi:hypothetical protein
VDKARECIEGFLEALAKAGEPIPTGPVVRIQARPFVHY